MTTPHNSDQAEGMDYTIGSSEGSRHVSVSWLSTDHPTITEKIAMILNICECVNLNDEDEVIGAFNNIHQTVQEILLLRAAKE